MSKTISLLLVMFLLTSCDTTKTIYVGPSLVDCEGASTQKCMQVKEAKEDDWTLFYDQIEGFDYKEGYTYKMDVTVNKVKNPPADGSLLKYKLIKLIYQELSENKTDIAQSLEGSWKVESIVGLKLLATQPSMTFKEGQLSGNAACNRYGTSFKIEGNSISFGLPIATKMMCSNMKIEKAFFSCLSQAASYKILNDKLIIYSKDQTELISCESSK